jgi:SAM-dependent methyltransferase
MSQPASGRVLDWGVGHYERTAERLLPAAQVLVEAASVRAGERVLDVGSGTGNAALVASMAGARVIAVDPSQRLLGVALATARERDLDVTCVVGEASALPAPARSVDCVLSNFGVIFAPDARAAATEMTRVLAPGGRIVFTAWLPGGAVGELAATTQELVRAAAGAPPAPPGFPWHDAAAVAELFSPHGLAVSAEGRHEIIFTGPSVEGFLEVELADHPLAIAAFEVLEGRGDAERARNRLLDVLNDHNEDPDGFRSTSRYVVLSARRG